MSYSSEDYGEGEVIRRKIKEGGMEAMQIIKEKRDDYYDGTFQEEDIDRTIPNLWLSGQNRSGGSVGRSKIVTTFTGSKPPGGF